MSINFKSFSLSVHSLGVLLVLLSGCEINWFSKRGNGELVQELRRLGSFDRIDIKGNYEVDLAEGEPGVLVDTDENLHPFIITEVRNNRLVIENTEKIRSKNNIHLIVYLERGTLNRLSSSGASIIRSEIPLIFQELYLDIPGAGLVDLLVEGERLNIDLSGAGLVKLNGMVRQQELNLSGAGSLSSYDLISEKTEINLSGLGSAEVYARKSIQIRLTGLGSIKVRGNPADVDQEVTGLGSIKFVDGVNSAENHQML
jgi:hypothetical protein